MAGARGSRWTKIRFVVGVAIGLAAVSTVVSSAGGIADALGAIRHLHVGWFVVGAIAEGLSFVALGGLLRRLVGREAGLTWLESTRLGLVILGLGNILPAAPAEGLTMAAVELKRRNVETRRVGLALGLLQWFTTRAVFGLVALNSLAVILLVRERHPVPHRWGIGVAAVVVLASLPISAWLITRRSVFEWLALALGRLQFWRPPTPTSELRAMGAAWHADSTRILGSAVNRATLVVFGGLTCAADAVCFRSALAGTGVHPRSGGFVVAYGAGMLASLVPFLPGGLGAVETVMPAILHRTGVPFGPAVAGVLAYRALGTLLPAVSGSLSLVMLRRQPVPEEPEAEDSGELADSLGLGGVVDVSDHPPSRPAT